MTTDENFLDSIADAIISDQKDVNEQPCTGFDFKDWIKVNGLHDIEHIFVKHDLTKLSNLCTQSTQFASFISDPILLQTQQHLISKSVTSIQKLSNTTLITQKRQYIIITEKEENALKLLQSHVQKLKSHELLNNEIYEKYISSIGKIKNRKTIAFENAQYKIKLFFEKLNCEIALKQEQLLKQLDAISEHHFDENEENKENKESETWTETKTLISKQINKLNESINSINEIIQLSTKENKEERQKQITSILDMSNSEFIQTNNKLDSNLRLLENHTQGNNLYDFDIDLKLNKHKKNILNIIKNIQLKSESTNENDEGVNSSDETIKSLSHYQEIINKQQKQISNLKSQNECYFSKITELQKTMYSLQNQVSNFYTHENGKKHKRKRKKKKKKN